MAPKPELCKHCAAPLQPHLLRCKKCGAWSLGGSALPVGALKESLTVLLSDATVSKVARIQTGFVDEFFGGGIAASSVNLLGGSPGAGKTTLCLQLADIFAAQFPGREVLYIANEQDANELKETAERLSITRLNQIRVVKAMGGLEIDLGALLTECAPTLIVLDSVSKWAGENHQAAVQICEALKSYSVLLSCPAFVINQVNKTGDHAGLNAMQHAVDCTALFDLMSDDPSEATPDTPRRLMSLKNRFGPAPQLQYFKMGVRGLETINLSDLEDSEESDE